MNYDENLLKLRRKKLRQQLRYLKLELEETQIVFQESLYKFRDDFKEDLPTELVNQK